LVKVAADDADAELCIGVENPESKRERRESIRNCSVAMAVGIQSVCSLRRHLPCRV
jgi:hypothetical protein